MLQDAVWIAVGIVVIGVVVWLQVNWLVPLVRQLREFDAEIASRESLSDKQMMQDYFSESDVPCEIVGQVRSIFAKHMEYSPEKLRPDDDLTFFWNELDMFDLIRELEVTFAITIETGDEFRTPCNIRSVSLLVHELKKSETMLG